MHILLSSPRRHKTRQAIPHTLPLPHPAASAQSIVLSLLPVLPVLHLTISLYSTLPLRIEASSPPIPGGGRGGGGAAAAAGAGGGGRTATDGAGGGGRPPPPPPKRSSTELSRCGISAFIRSLTCSAGIPSLRVIASQTSKQASRSSHPLFACRSRWRRLCDENRGGAKWFTYSLKSLGPKDFNLGSRIF